MAVVTELPKLQRIPGGIETRTADVDLSNYLYCGVAEVASVAAGRANVTLPSQGAKILGVLLNSPIAGDQANIAVSPSVVGMSAGTALNAGVDVMVDTSGRCIAATGGNYVIGRTEEAALAINHVVRVKLGTYKI